jgi:hypothetical protein
MEPEGLHPTEFQDISSSPCASTAHQFLYIKSVTSKVAGLWPWEQKTDSTNGKPWLRFSSKPEQGWAEFSH